MPALRKRSRSTDLGQQPAMKRFLVSGADVAAKSTKKGLSGKEIPVVEAQPFLEKELGDGTHSNPFFLPIRLTPNVSGCVHCHQRNCQCRAIEELLSETYSSVALKRVTEVAGARQLCAKSLLPPFVARIINLLKITRDTKFVDFGCGNGSILFQVACVTGAQCVGIEISEHNAQLARDAWHIFRQKYEKRFGSTTTGDVTIVTGDGAAIIAAEDFFDGGADGTAVLLSNLLFPKPLTHYISERMRTTPVGTRVLCFDDLYPHGRSLASIRDPEAFKLFDMQDYKWQEMSVEWCCQEGNFYVHWRK